MNKTIIFSTILMMSSLIACSPEKDPTESEVTTNRPRKINNDYIQVEIGWDTSKYFQIYKLTDSTFTFCLRNSVSKDSCILNEKVDNVSLLEELGRDTLDTDYLVENSYYSNGVQTIKIKYQNKLRTISVQDFSADPLNKITNRINNNMTADLKEFIIQK
jgi:hypothetical protein